MNKIVHDADESSIDEAIVQDAVAWFATLASGQASDAELTALTRWRAEHPDHERAWQRLEAVRQRFQRGVELGSPEVMRDVVATTDATRAARRRVLKAFGGIAVLGGSALLVSRQPQWQGMLAQHRTRTGERLQLSLPDGTRIHLNTATALSAQFDERQRAILLHHGECQIITAADPMRRPFSVITTDGTVSPVGTKFIVRHYDDDTKTRVRVFSGAVDVQPSIASSAARRVSAGQQIAFTSHAAGRPEPLDAAATTWVDGMLSAERMPLNQFLDTLARHRAGWLRYDPAIADLRITGAFPLDDTDRVLDAVARSLPVKVNRLTRYWVTVAPR